MRLSNCVSFAKATTWMGEEEARRRVSMAESQVASLKEVLKAQAKEVADARRRLLNDVITSDGEGAAGTQQGDNPPSRMCCFGGRGEGR